MKIRKGYISNSSSSSFIVALDPTETEIKLTVTVQIGDIIDKSVKTEKELLDYLDFIYGWKKTQEDAYVMSLYTKSMEAINNGKIVYFGSVSNESDGEVQQLIYYGGLASMIDSNCDVILDGDY